MDTPNQSSFIPQDAASLSTSSRIKPQAGLSDLILLLSIVAFVASLALAGGVFLYDEYLKTSAASKVDQLNRAKEAFEPSLIRTLTRVDDRLIVADHLISGHIAPTAFFQILQNATLSTVSFRSIDFNATDPKNITIKMSGVARSVNSIALQADLFSKHGAITNPIFSDINRGEGGINFTLEASINPSAINYVRLINSLVQEQAGGAGVQGVQEQIQQEPLFETPMNQQTTPPPQPDQQNQVPPPTQNQF